MERRDRRGECVVCENHSGSPGLEELGVLVEGGERVGRGKSPFLFSFFFGGGGDKAGIHLGNAWCNGT